MICLQFFFLEICFSITILCSWFSQNAARCFATMNCIELSCVFQMELFYVIQVWVCCVFFQEGFHVFRNSIYCRFLFLCIIFVLLRHWSKAPKKINDIQENCEMKKQNSEIIPWNSWEIKWLCCKHYPRYMNHLRYQLDGLTEALRKPYIKVTLQNIETTLVLDGFPATRFFLYFTKCTPT